MTRDVEFRCFHFEVRNSDKFRNWNSMEFQSYLFMNEKLTGIQQNADKYYWISAEFEMVLVKRVYGIEIQRNSSSGFDNIGIPVEIPRNSGCGIPVRGIPFPY
jgi:hypothetical protein